MNKSDKKNFLIDGFPRNKENIDEWQKSINDKVNIQFVLVFDCDEKVTNMIISCLT
jgi:UMP-CMP kinase